MQLSINQGKSMNNIKASIVKGNSNVRVARATDPSGSPLVVAPIENILVVNGFAINPDAKSSEVEKGGDAIYAAVEKCARVEGVSKVWIVVPDDCDRPDVRTIRVVEEKVPQALATQRIGSCNPIPPVTYLN
jgi:hypothetical protein